ncbi:hypothetical protein FQN54_001579 [Arachnomyces sp. PD_36]|nr:hypothetical protein FQN54_001579 [Arachnomyces sp. PD_36]
MAPPRSSHAPASSRKRRRRTADDGPPKLPPLEPPIDSLDDNARKALTALLQSDLSSNLNQHIKDAGHVLADSAGSINERLTDARTRFQKRVKRGGGAGREEETVERLEGQVFEVTGRLEAKMRKVVDAGVRVKDMEIVTRELKKECDEAIAARDKRARGWHVDEEETWTEPDSGDEEDKARPSEQLDDKLAEKKARWNKMSLTEKYTTNNAYIGFYRITYEAKFPNDSVPPLPPASAWFDPPNLPQAITTTLLPDRTSNRTQHPQPQSATQRNARQAAGGNNNDDDDDVAIAHERIAPKCPITLRPFSHAVTSTKCPHSFEREAITDMINRSKDIRRSDGSQINHRGSRRGAAAAASEGRIHYVRCPVCDVNLSLGDLRDDPVLMRRVRRAEEIEAAEREEEELGIVSYGGGRGGRRSGVTVADDGDDEIEDPEVRDAKGIGSGAVKREVDEARQKKTGIKRESRAVSVTVSTRQDSTLREYATIDDEG